MPIERGRDPYRAVCPFRGTDQSAKLQPLSGEYWRTPVLGRALAMLDYNRDGKPDLVAGHVDAPTALLQNDSQTGNWIRLDLVGTSSERDAVGARVTLVAGDRSYVSWITGGDGYHCTNQSGVDFGLGRSQRIDELIVHWPSGLIQEFGELSIGSHYLLVEGQDQQFELIESE